MGQFQFKVINHSKTDIDEIVVTDVNPPDWHNNGRPDLKISGRHLKAGKHLEEGLEIVKKKGHVFFNIKLCFADGSIDNLIFEQQCVEPYNTNLRSFNDDPYHKIDIQRNGKSITVKISDHPHHLFH